MSGTLIRNAPIGAQSWFGCGGSADLLFQPDSIEDLQVFLKSAKDITIIGGLANTIIRDGGIRGVVIQPDKALSTIEVLNETDMYVETGALNGSVAAAALKAGIGGFEFLSGIPGKIGGAIAMNAGAYGAEMKDILVEASGLDTFGIIQKFTPSPRSVNSAAPHNPPYPLPQGEEEFLVEPSETRNSGEGVRYLGMTYRHTDLPPNLILTSCVLRGVPDVYENVKARLSDIKSKRNATQPIREKTGGSTFANPSPEELAKAGLPEGTRAWKVVELVGGRGLTIGGAQMSEQHCNFMINTGSSTAADLEALGEELHRRALEQFGLDLRWEIKRMGQI